MNTPDSKPTLDDILNEIASEPAPPNPTEIRAILTRFPQFKAEIIDFLTAWIELELTRDAQEVADVNVDRVVNRTMSRVMQILHDPEGSQPLSDFAGAIRAAGHDLKSFERIVGVDRSLLTMLETRQILPASIPALLVDRIASALGRTADTVWTYLALPAKEAEAYMSTQPPRVTQVGFVEAVRGSTLPEADQDWWLAEPLDPRWRT